jgi:hypothetical protein
MRISQFVPKKMITRQVMEILIYAILVTVYLAVVLHFLTGWLKEMFTHQPFAYSFVSIALMILQATGLEKLTSMLLSSNRPPRR